MYFWLKCIVCIVVIIISTYIVTLRELFTSTTTSEKYNAISTPDYHTTEDQIREEEKHKMNVMYVKDVSGRYVGVNMEKTQNFPTYYTPGDFPFGPAAYIPSYSDTVILPLSRDKT
jgi:hypothetical protein